MNISLIQAKDKISKKEKTRTIFVPATLVANNDDFSSIIINGLIGGSPGNVFANDTSDGSTVTAALVLPSIVSDGTLAGVTIS